MRRWFFAKVEYKVYGVEVGPQNVCLGRMLEVARSRGRSEGAEGRFKLVFRFDFDAELGEFPLKLLEGSHRFEIDLGVPGLLGIS